MNAKVTKFNVKLKLGSMLVKKHLRVIVADLKLFDRDPLAVILRYRLQPHAIEYWTGHGKVHQFCRDEA